MTGLETTNQDYNIDFERIKELISLFEQKKNSGEIRKYNEESTKKDFILPLFEALGWNVYNRGKKNDSISAEETISKKRVDYGFRINGIPKFFLEAKSLKEDNIHNNPNYVTQAIDYAWMKSCSWAILTNFETIAVYNADWKESNNLEDNSNGLEDPDYLEYAKDHEIVKSEEFRQWILTLKPKDVKDKGISHQALYYQKSLIRNGKSLNIKQKVVKILLQLYKDTILNNEN